MSAHRFFLLLAAPLAIAGCKKTVDTKGFEKTIEERVKGLGLTPDKVSCPDGVAAKKDAKFVCKIEIEKASYDLDVTITEVKESNVSMDTAWSKGRAVVRSKIIDMVPVELEKQLGAKVTVDCGKEALVFLTGDQLDCKLASGAASSKLALTFDENYNMTGWKLEPGLLARTKLVELLTPSVREKTNAEVTVDCGSEELLVRPVDGNLWCSIKDKDQTSKIRVAVKEDLTIEKWEVATPDAP